MKRTVITAESITSAHSRGETELTVPYTAVVTPAARDTASSLGIRVRRDASDAKTGRDTPGVRTKRDASDVKTGRDAPGPSLHTGAVRDEESKTQESPGFTPKLFDDVKRRVLARLPTSLHAYPLLDELLRTSLTLLCAQGRNPAQTGGPGGETQAIAGASAVVPAQVSAPPVPDAPGAAATAGASAVPGAPPAPTRPETAWKTSAGGALLVKASALPWQRSPLGDAVNVIDVVGGPSPFEAGYMEWEAASFAWTLERDELFTVLDGSLRVRVAGETLSAGPGDMVYLPRGAEAEFSSSGRVTTAYSACAPSCPCNEARSGGAARRSDAARPGNTVHFSNTKG